MGRKVFMRGVSGGTRHESPIILPAAYSAWYTRSRPNLRRNDTLRLGPLLRLFVTVQI
jgi:hypothetical protein